jgi:hypothetical protein
MLYAAKIIDRHLGEQKLLEMATFYTRGGSTLTHNKTSTVVLLLYTTLEVYTKYRMVSIDAQELLQAVPTVFQSADHVEEQPDLSVRHGFPGRKPPIFKSSACRWKREMGGLRSGILALCVRLWSI